LRAAVVVIWIVGAAIEFPYHLAPTIPRADDQKLYILGDSVAAGMGERRKETWPLLLARSRRVEVTDLSQMGATVESALRQAESLPPEGGLVLLEIGGNDLLGSTSAAQFEHDLDRLLASVCKPGRVVVMFELPLPPFSNEYGRAQRHLAAEYRVWLIPKRIFLAVLTGEEATLDSVHLSRNGHERMAETVWKILQPAFGNEPSHW
jgi:acyl-CoA thioesterase-1